MRRNDNSPLISEERFNSVGQQCVYLAAVSKPSTRIRGFACKTEEKLLSLVGLALPSIRTSYRHSLRSIASYKRPGQDQEWTLNPCPLSARRGSRYC